MTRCRPSSRARSFPSRLRRSPGRRLRPPQRATARPASSASTCTVRASLSQLSSHSPTTGITTSSVPIAASTSHAAATAPSKTRPTAIVEVRKIGVSISPHSEIWRKPVSSPAPFRAVAPAATGLRKNDSPGPGRIAVTPVRALPRPTGGSGSSRTTVTWPTRTPATSVIAFAAPASRWPMRRPCSRSVNSLMEASLTLSPL